LRQFHGGGKNFGDYMRTKLRPGFVCSNASCTYCCMPASTKCEFTGCALPMCGRHALRKFGGDLCRDHFANAMLMQPLGEPGAGAIAEDGVIGNFKAKGDAVPRGGSLTTAILTAGFERER
jgi:hypothetical protein